MSNLALIPEEGGGGVTSEGYHKISSSLKCLKRMWYANLGITPLLNAGKIPDYYVIGTLMHAGRAAWIAEGSPAEFGTKPRAAIQSAFDQEKERGVVDEVCVSISTQYMHEYIEHYKMRAAPKVVATERLIKHTDKHGVTFTARLDDLSFYAERGGRLCIGECKTTSGSIADAIEEYRLHPQTLLQQYLYKEDLQHVYGPVEGTILDIIKKGYDGKPCGFARHFVEFRKELVDECAEWLYWHKRNLPNMEIRRDFSACSIRKSSRIFACPYRDLCIEGRDATLRYVDADNNILLRSPTLAQLEVWK